jgi:hypothetical protein
MVVSSLAGYTVYANTRTRYGVGPMSPSHFALCYGHLAGMRASAPSHKALNQESRENHVTLRYLTCNVYRMLQRERASRTNNIEQNTDKIRYYTALGTATPNERHSSKAVTQVLYEGYTASEHRTFTSPSSTERDLLAQQRATTGVFTSKDDSNNPRAQPTHRQGPAHAPGTCGASMLAGRPRFRIWGGVAASPVVHS